jgi:ferric-dicitrate binding protein FerR (iron transport regulator)
MASEDKIWLLISRSISGDITEPEAEELENIFQEHPEFRADYENLKKIRIEPRGIISLEERRALERGIEKFKLSINGEDGFNDVPLFGAHQLKPLRRKRSEIWMVAASVITLLFVGVYTLAHHKNTSPNQQVLAAQYGKRIHTILPDGSSVWLNSGSSIKYANNLIVNGKRQVLLTGEGYFDIKHDAKHPFIVHAGKLNIVVLGTAFDVKAYAGDEYIETTLIRGKVEILNDNKPDSGIVLYPNEKVSVNTTNQNEIKEGRIISKAPVTDSVSSEKNTPPILPDENITETSWVTNSLSFSKEDFTDLAKQLERWYNVEIVFDNGTYSAKQFTGTFKNQDINEVMRALQFTQPFHYAITNNQIHIW